MTIPFWKVYAEGNSYLIVDEPANAGELLPWVVDQWLGLGGDGLLLADWRRDGTIGMRVFNADGTEAPACGNGARCVAALAILTGRVESEAVVAVHSPGTVMTHRLLDRQEMKEMKLIQTMAVPADPVIWRAAGQYQVDLGTAHRVIFADLDGLEADREGRRQSREWAGGTNVMFTNVTRPGRLRVVPWERGVGPTRGCASGAAAAVIAAAEQTTGWPDATLVELPGGMIEVHRHGKAIDITGTVRLIAQGTLTS